MTETNRTTLPEYCFTPISDDTTLRTFRYWLCIVDEVWRIIADFPDYAVSTWGRVRRETKGWHAKPGRILRPSGAGTYRLYPSVHLWRNSERSTVNVHTLVARAFILQTDPLDVEVDHLDSENLVNGMLDNRAANLQWTTKRRNNELCDERGRRPRGETHYYHTKPGLRSRDPLTGCFLPSDNTKPRPTYRMDSEDDYSSWASDVPPDSLPTLHALPDSTVDAIRRDLQYPERFTCIGIARRHGVSFRVVYHIKRGARPRNG